MKKTLNFIFRLISLPFAIMIVAIAAFRAIISFGYRWLAHGGELITYDKDEVITIRDVYDKVKEFLTEKDRPEKEPEDPTYSKFACEKELLLNEYCMNRNLPFECMEERSLGDSNVMEFTVKFGGDNGYIITTLYHYNRPYYAVLGEHYERALKEIKEYLGEK